MRYGKRFARPFLDPGKYTNMKKKAALSFLLAIAVAGCAKSPERLAAELRADEADCRSQGFQVGTDNFRLCLLTLREGRDTRESAAASASRAEFAAFANSHH